MGPLETRDRSGEPVEGALVGIENDWKKEKGSGTKERDVEGIYVEGERERERERIECLGLGDDGENFFF